MGLKLDKSVAVLVNVTKVTTQNTELSGLTKQRLLSYTVHHTKVKAAGTLRRHEHGSGREKS